MLCMDEIKVDSKDVMYDNAFNRANLGGLSAVASNLLMLIARDVRDKGTQQIIFSDEDLSQEYLIGHRKTSEVVWALFDISTSLAKITAPLRNGTKIKVKTVFKEFEIESKDGYQKERLKVTVNEDYLFLFNELASHFTIFQLQEFASLRTTRAKTLYRMLKQFRTQGWLYLSVEDVLQSFFRLEKMPDDYETVVYYQKNRRYIKPQVLQNATEECSRYFKNLKVSTIKEDHKRGKPIKGFKWTFDAEKSNKSAKKESGKVGAKKKSKLEQYNSFEQRNYDYKELERRLANLPEETDNN